MSTRQTEHQTAVSETTVRTEEHSSGCSSPLLSLSSPLVKKTRIQIPSFDDKGLIYEKHNSRQIDINSSRSFVTVCSTKTSSQSSWSKSSQQNLGEKASTLPRTKRTTCCSPTLSTKPRISIFCVPNPKSSPTNPLKPRPGSSISSPTSQLNDPSPLPHQTQPRVSPTLTVPTLRRSPSPTSLCREMRFDNPEGKQPSPVAKERCARSISISNTATEPESSSQRSSNEAKYHVLDQETLIHFTHSTPGSKYPKESQHQTYSESHRQLATSQSSSLSQGTVGSSKSECIAKPRLPPRNMNASSIPKPNSFLKQQKGFLNSGATGIQTSLPDCEGIKTLQKESQSAFEEPTNQSSLSLHKKRAEYSLNRLAGFASKDQLPERTFSERSAAIRISPNIESRRRQFSFNNEAKADTTFLSGSGLRRPQQETNVRTITGPLSKISQQTRASPNVKSPQKHRFWSKAQSETSQMDMMGALSHPSWALMDYNSLSKDIDLKMEVPQSMHRLNQFKACLEMPHTQEVFDSFEGTKSKVTNSRSGISYKHLLDHEEGPGKDRNPNIGNVSDTGLNEMQIVAPLDHPGVATKLTKYPSVGVNCPFITENFSTSSKGVFDLPAKRQHGVYRIPDMTKTDSSAPHQPNYSPAGRAFITDESEDPYYVTMYCPDSVYVDMSDVVPPEVRPKPAIPAKPPNVGAASPSSPFPPQGSGMIGGGGVSAHPPSGIPVPIGTHGSMHISAHSVSQGHTAAHNGGHGHSHGHGGSLGSGGGSTLLGYIGIDTIIEQMRKKTMKTGFDFNIMVVGNSGLGKSTLVNTLFKSQVSRRSAGWARDEKIPKTVDVKAVSHVLEEGGVKMKLTVIDTPGFGDQINNDNCWEPISKYINEQYEKFLKEEVNITRKKRIPDTRVHCCLYFISPTGHSLRQLDIEFMKRLSHSVNIIPVIAKADTMTIEERQEFKQRVRKELEMGGIEFYPQKEFDEDMEDKSDNDKIREAMPFAVVGSDKEYQVNGKRVLGRKTPWGIVEVENPNHCEFALLRDFLIRSHLQDLKEVTHNIHYETFRAKRLNENGGLHPISSNDTQESNL
ncbi:neuronal-specific septin-3 isoform X1 [Antennarius striatus]|uniref:neuronal-specific septin-3 isoform X1 n=2 Tax=Antennarius striatus TaxID=241820 RepID=UPI0035B0C5D1